MSEKCPVTLQERHDEDIQKLFDLALPEWVRGTVIGIFTILFVLYGGLWFYLLTQYPTRDDVKEMRVELREDLQEIKDKLDNARAVAAKDPAANRTLP
jgi:hypothetical protein